MLKTLGAILFVVALPLAVVSTNLRLMLFDPGLWAREYERQGVGRTTGMSPEQLRTTTDQIMAYFRGGPMVSLEVQKEWGREPLYNQREQTHLLDVRDLVWRALRVQEVSLAYVLIFAGLVLLRGGLRPLVKPVSAGAGLTLAMFAGIGVLAIGNFQGVWLQFHLLSFTNDFWQLDPRTDYMIRMFPEGFWFNMVLELVGRSALAAALLFVATQLYQRLQPNTTPAPARIGRQAV